ncbi:HEAT repeat domain-containing protein [Actinoplanes sp. G11-F43]|uniref:HEAT repeat domain-containing protein n=1 Tax=Actinoplanes sp. G11-F43 TaxID=3424130 RepID=UPI003D33BAB9
MIEICEPGGEQDVRWVMAALRGAGEPELDAVPWARFTDECWAPDAVPNLLRALSNPDHASSSLSELWTIVRTEGTSDVTGALAVPFLLRIAADPAASQRGELLKLAAEVGHRNHFGTDMRASLFQMVDEQDRETIDGYGRTVAWTCQAAREAVTVDAPLLIGLLDDPTPPVRANAAYALAGALMPPPEVTAAMRERLAVETSPAVRISLVLALAQLAVEHADSDVTGWTAALWADLGNLPDVRFAAALAWLCATTEPVPDRMLDLFAEVVDVRLAEAMDDVPWPNHNLRRGGLAAWLVAFLGDMPDVQTDLVALLAVSPHPALRASALRAAYAVASEWRSRTDAMIGLLADRLHDTDPAVRRSAARHLVRAGAAVASAADRIAVALDDPDPEVWAWTVVTLARLGDARAVEPLADLLSRPAYPWPEPRWHPDGNPDPGNLLPAMSPYAERLAPVVIARLADMGNGWQRLRCDLLQGISHWGEHGAGAVALLTELLTVPNSDRTTVVSCLARIGPPAAAAVPLLDRLAAGAEPGLLAILVWTRWRITGKRAEDTAATLAQLASLANNGSQPLRLLADLGPVAAAHAPAIRARLSADNHLTTRVQAAFALWSATGNTADTVPILTAVLDESWEWNPFGSADTTVVDYLARMGPAAAAAVPALTAFLEADRRIGQFGLNDPVDWDQRCRQSAMAALRAIRPAPR